ncbi:hypothetical protein [Spirillospora sp. NPDC047279]|uniref:hypothetical protein n=1 Tax=Spirillospora sp. NPDC047279 TaxID=3155478 RepID=UPI003407537D
MRATRRLVYLGLGAMVVFTGGYVVVYLARWEWQRALMAGELLLISLIVLVAVAGAHRLARMEARLTRPAENAGQRAAVPEPPMTAPAPPPRFRWLEPDSDAYKVFIPVLLGAGIMMSGIAALVERIAAAFGGSARRAAPGTAAFGRVRAPSALRLPSDGVLAGAPGLGPPAPPDRRRPFKPIAWTLAGLLVAAVIVVEMAERTQDRPDPPMNAAASTLILEARTHGVTGAATADPLATRLWEYCRGSTRPYLERGAVAPLGDGRYALVVQPALGEYSLRRFRGCLEDALIDGGTFRVVSVQPVPEDGPTPSG